MCLANKNVFTLSGCAAIILRRKKNRYYLLRRSGCGFCKTETELLKAV